MLTSTRTHQINEIRPHGTFQFVESYNGNGTYIKIGNTHYRKAGPQHIYSVCLPIKDLSLGIRTMVIPAPERTC